MNPRLYIATHVLKALIARGGDYGSVAVVTARALTVADGLIALEKSSSPATAARAATPPAVRQRRGQEVPDPRVSKQRARAIREDIEKRGGDAV
jgi:hypothetical protein